MGETVKVNFYLHPPRIDLNGHANGTCQFGTL